MPERWRVSSSDWKDRATLSIDHLIARVADEQWGVISRRQLRALGIGDSSIDRRVRQGRLRRVHRGVYAVGHGALTTEGWWMAALLACGEDSAIARRSAGALLDLRAYAGARAEVAVPRGSSRGSRLIRTLRTQLEPQDVVVVRGLRVTSPARTLLDLASVLPPVALGEAVDRSIRLGLYDQRAVDDLLARSQGRPGAAALRADLAGRHPDRELTRSWLERVFLPMLDEAGLPRPSINVWLPEIRHEVDLLWPDHKVVVELDGYEGHGRRRQFDLDREQTIELEDRGYTVRRYSRNQVKHRPAWAIDRLARTLARIVR